MAIDTWDNFQRLTMPSLPGCPWIIIKEAVIDASVEFFEKSKAWKTDPKVSFNTTANVSTCTPSLSGSIVKINSIQFTGSDNYLEPVRFGLVEPSTYSSTGTPQEYQQLDNTTIELFPTPDAVYSLSINCSMKPDKATATGIEHYLFENYSDYIASGAIYRVAIVPQKDWSNPDIAAFHKANFEQGIKFAINKDMQGVIPRAKPRMF